MYDGVADVFRRAAAVPSIPQAFTIGGGATDIYRSWASMFSVAFVSMLAILLLPRQFQVAVVENVDESHIEKAHPALPALPFPL